MPTFVVHEIGKPPLSTSLQLQQIVIGRDPACSVVLNNASVSRQHAVVQQLDDGRWACQALKDENPLVVDGQITVATQLLREGSQLQIGRFFLIFSLETEVRTDYMADQKQYEAVCQGCQWKGVVSAMARAPACPKCGGSAFIRSDDLASAAKGPALSGPTAYLRPDDLKEMHDRINRAKNAQLERVDGPPGLPRSLALTETEPCVFGGKGANMPIAGFKLGGPATIEWERSQYVVHKGGLWPTLKVNGEAVKDKRGLNDGDEVVLGANRFRFVVAS